MLEVNELLDSGADATFDIANKNISILIGGDMPQLHINYDVVMGRPNEPIATLKKIRMGSVRR